ncbi:hypothetical protein TNIN_486241 [Trichonephila inaurata madagascariensis]|uniref:Uncharacterized protein n=1 Tax=Trichonephila inaurata madagascariensis TaxID=2747483 RepID=A0A8X6WUK4_9ARAC|nr:hypothetical protein TNIN_486241 [Trichonephila inaurata madagascariensis]
MSSRVSHWDIWQKGMVQPFRKKNDFSAAAADVEAVHKLTREISDEDELKNVVSSLVECNEGERPVSFTVWSSDSGRTHHRHLGIVLSGRGLTSANKRTETTFINVAWVLVKSKTLILSTNELDTK